MKEEKELLWVGSSYDDLLEFPREARRTAGFELGKVQAGLEPEDWKPFDLVGAGTREIRIRDTAGIFRVMTLRSSRKLATSCTASRRRLRQPASTTRTLRRLGIEPW